jgi:four helix bundle protein
MEENKGDIKERSFELAVRIIKFVQKLPGNHLGYKIGGQLLEAATSIGANVEEATGGFSKKDFTYKMGVALKEARESNYWLRLIKVSELTTGNELDYLLKESEELRKILTHSAAPSPAFEGGVKKRRSGLTLSKPRPSGRGVEGLTSIVKTSKGK